MKFAVVGGGISGLTASYLLARGHEVTLFEGSSRLGGHTYTVTLPGEDGPLRVDMGFIVFNEKNYPRFTRLLRDLGVDSQPSEMSFSVRAETSGLEYRSTSLDTLFAQRRNALSPSFHRLLLDVVRFNRRSRALLRNGEGSRLTLEEYVGEGSYSRRFWDEYLAPMAAAIWSSAPENVRAFPARYLVRFFANHGFLDSRGGLSWRTVRGGSDTYVRRMVSSVGLRIRLGYPVRQVARHRDFVSVSTDEGTERFDHVVLAAHSDQALAMLKDPTDAEIGILSRMKYQANDTILHTDAEVLPRNRRARASWNYLVPAVPRARPRVTYYSNRLQDLPGRTDYCVSLNQCEAIRPERIVERVEFHHPLYTLDSLDAQSLRAEISGRNRTSYCGAYWGYGFHEDGVESAVEAVRPFGVSP
jgi:predicted NAD/FAD-binding protein